MEKSIKRDDYVRAGLALSLIPEIGANRIKSLFEQFDSPLSLFNGNLRELVQVNRIGASVAQSILSFRDWDKVDRLLQMADKLGASIVTPFDDTYPYRLKEIDDPPALLWVKGDPEVLKRDFFAIVGTRRPSAEGREATVRLTRELIGTTDLAVVSGLAHGVDTIAHRVTLEENACTVAVLGCGIDRVYPSGNYRLAQRILQQGGAIISEFFPGTLPEAHNFPVRNRIVSGMSLGVLVTETGLTGGSRITAARALEQNREVFAVPHSISNEKGAGSNDIIRKACGKLVTCAADILVEFPCTQVPHDEETNRYGARNSDSDNYSIGIRSTEPTDKPDPSSLNNQEQQIFRMISEHPIYIDELAAKLQLPAKQLLTVLLKLELAGFIERKSGKKFTAKIW